MNPVNYGDLVFAKLQPVFAQSMCKAWQDDFLVHDKRTFANTAVPGMEYLWCVRHTGTNLFVLKVGEKLETYFAASSCERVQQIHHVVVRPTGATCRLIESVEAQRLMMQPLGFTITQDLQKLSNPRHYTVTKGPYELATATVTDRYDRATSRAFVDMDLCFRPQASLLGRMHVKLALERVINRQVGSLFWGFDRVTVDGMPLQDWVTQSTSVPEPTLA
jgi:hypothetical protein